VTTRLRHVAAVNPPTPEFDRLPDEAAVSFLPLEAIWPGGDLDTSRRRPRHEASVGYTRFREGDVLVPKITPTFQADRTVIVSGLEGGIGAGTTELHIVRVGPSADARYIRYLLSSKPFLDEGEASMFGVAGQKRVPDSCVRDLVVPVTERLRQRAIADYLDAETARIGALIDKKRRMVTLLQERFWSAVDELVHPAGAPVVALSRSSLSWCDGPFGSSLTSAHYSASGARVVRLGNIGRGRFRNDDEAFIPLEYFQELRHHEVRAGDLLIAGLGDENHPLGRACVAPDLGPTIVKADCFRFRLNESRLLPQFAAWYLSSPQGAAITAELAKGSTRARASLGVVPRLRIPRPTVDLQRQVLRAIDYEDSEHAKVQASLARQLRLLVERRQALITAAVTGELDVAA